MTETVRDAVLSSYEIGCKVSSALKLEGRYLASVHNHYTGGPQISVFRNDNKYPGTLFQVQSDGLKLLSISPQEKDNEQAIAKMLSNALAKPI